MPKSATKKTSDTSVIYKVPKSAEQLMTDFYAMAGLKVRAVEYGLASYDTAGSDIEVGSFIRDRKLADEAVAVRKQVIEAERGRLLRDLPLINAAEVKHLLDNMSKPQNGSIADTFKQRFGAAGTLWLKVFKAVLNGGHDYKVVAKPAEFVSGGYVPRYIAAETASRESGIPLVEVAMLAFDTQFFQWSSSYGGPKWLVIAEAWADLLDAQTEDEVIHWIDIINALQHNTTTLFNKCGHYGSLSFLSKVLDIKFAARTPLSFVGKCSEQIQPYLLAVRDGIAALDSQVRDLSASRFYFDSEKGLWIERELNVGKKGSKEAVDFVKTLGTNGVITLLYEGKDRTFQVNEILTAIDGSRQFIMRPHGWTKYKPGTHVSISYFPFDEAELVSMFVAAGAKGSTEVETPSLASKKKSGGSAAHAFTEKLRNAVANIASENGFSVGAVHNSGDLYRIRVHKEGETNCRYYVKAVAPKKFRLYFDFNSSSNDNVDTMTALISEAQTIKSADIEKLAKAITDHAVAVWANGGPSAVPFKMKEVKQGGFVEVKKEAESVTYTAKVEENGGLVQDKTAKKKGPKGFTTAQEALSDLDLDDIEEITVVGKQNGFVKVSGNSDPVAYVAAKKHFEVVGEEAYTKITSVDVLSEFIKAVHFANAKDAKFTTVIQQVVEGQHQVAVIKTKGSGTVIETVDFSSKALAAGFFETACDDLSAAGMIQKGVTAGG